MVSHVIRNNMAPELSGCKGSIPESAETNAVIIAQKIWTLVCSNQTYWSQRVAWVSGKLFFGRQPSLYMCTFLLRYFAVSDMFYFSCR